MFLIVGLGNPGKQYEQTRHNVGFMAVDALSSRYNFFWQNKDKFKSLISDGNIGGKVILCKPTTFMNLSGEAVQLVAAYYKIQVANLIVIHDDLDLEIGQVKIKLGGGSAGHNGIKSLDRMLSTPNYLRIRVGIGRPESNLEVSEYVLQAFLKTEKEIIEKKLYNICEKLPILLNGNLEQFRLEL